MIRIGINLLFLYGNRNGGAKTYVVELLRELLNQNGFEWVLFTNQSNHEWFAESHNVKRFLTTVSGARRGSRIIYEQLFLCSRARERKCQILFCPGYLSPLWPSLPTVVSILDTQFRDVPHSISFAQRIVYDLIIPRACRKARHILTISEFARNRIHLNLGVPVEKITVTLLGPRRLQIKAPSEDQANRILSGLRLRSPYLLTVASGGAPHKNISKLVQGFQRFQQARESTCQLAIAGSYPAKSPEFVKLIQTENVRFLGFLSDVELDVVYRNAAGFAFASLYEGFGLPLLEAMAYGLPVASSNAACLPEVCGNAAIFFDPLSVESIADSLAKLMEEPGKRGLLVESGRENLNRFSWKTCADKTVDVFRSVLATKASQIS